MPAYMANITIHKKGNKRYPFFFLRKIYIRLNGVKRVYF